MALYPVATVSPCITYNLWDGVVPVYEYNKYLVTPPRLYDEEIDWFGHFFYEKGNDLLVAYAAMKTYQWPGWDVNRFIWNAETGALLSSTPGFNVSIVAWLNHAGAGSLGQIFTTWKRLSKLTLVSWDNLSALGIWEVDTLTWSPSGIFTHVAVNLQDNFVVGVSDYTLETWDISGTPALVGSLRLPNTLGYLAYEDRKSCWVVTHDGLIAKANYQIPRWEMLSAVQNPSPDATNYLCAFDIKRKRLAVLRQRPNAANGACLCQLEFYRPVYRVAGITEPVPVSPLRAGERTRFVAHLYGDAGEGVAGYMVNAALDDPALGAVLSPMSASELNGAVTFRYQAPGAGEDTLQLSATITDGEG